MGRKKCGKEDVEGQGWSLGPWQISIFPSTTSAAAATATCLGFQHRFRSAFEFLQRLATGVQHGFHTDGNGTAFSRKGLTYLFDTGAKSLCKGHGVARTEGSDFCMPIA